MKFLYTLFQLPPAAAENVETGHRYDLLPAAEHASKVSELDWLSLTRTDSDSADLERGLI